MQITITLYFAGSSCHIPFIRVSLADDEFPAFSGDFVVITVVGEEDTSREDKIEPLPEVLNIKSVKNRELLNLLNLLQENLWHYNMWKKQKSKEYI